jgi:hypothetical protein
LFLASNSILSDKGKGKYMYLDIKYTKEQIVEKRELVRNKLLLASENITDGQLKCVADSDLYILYNLYDEIFLNHYFRDQFKGKLKFLFSRQLTSSGGLTRCIYNLSKVKPQDYSFEIKIAVNFLFDYNKTNRDKIVNGYTTKDALDAMLLIFEHELCHVIEFLHTNKSSCKKQPFKTMASELFAHTDVYHGLPTKREISTIEYGIKVGQKVSFDFEGKIKKGFVKAINKRATIMVEDTRGSYVDKLGNRYSKYYVPVNQLKSCK